MFCPILAKSSSSQQIFIEVPQYQISRKFVQWGGGGVLIYTDRRTDIGLDMTKLTGDSHDEANDSKNIKVDLKGRDVW
jgi:hypothetical protein